MVRGPWQLLHLLLLLIRHCTAAFRAFENIGTSSQGDCDSELISAQQVSDASNWEGF